jgi:hypothetical protein
MMLVRATIESLWAGELFPEWNNAMKGYLALLRGTLCVSRDKGELDNLLGGCMS